MYEKIIKREHPKSEKHPPMPRLNRAAQFAPFAALTGFDDKIEDETLFVDMKYGLDAETAARFEEFMRILRENVKSNPQIFTSETGDFLIQMQE